MLFYKNLKTLLKGFVVIACIWYALVSHHFFTFKFKPAYKQSKTVQILSKDNNIKHYSIDKPLVQPSRTIVYESNLTQATIIQYEHVICNQTRKLGIVKGKRIVLLSAHFDNRSFDKPEIHVYAVNNFWHDINDSMYCRIWKNNTLSTITKAIITKLSWKPVNGTHYVKHIYDCLVSFDFKLYIEICSLNNTFCSNKAHVIYSKQTSKPEHLFGVCVRVSYGSLPDTEADSIIEWFEFNRLLGVSEFNIYNASLQLGPKIQNVFGYYVKEDILRIHQMPSPVHCYNSYEVESVGNLLMEASLNDCLYRNMYRYRHLIMIDLDEIIIPNKTKNYSDLLKDLERGTQKIVSNQTSFRFWSNNYFHTLPQDNKQPSFLDTMRFQYHVPSASRPKQMHNPRLCLQVNVHGCTKPQNGIWISRELASIHHHRKVCVSTINPGHWTKEFCEKLMTIAQKGTSILRYKPEILRRVKLINIAINNFSRV